MVVSLTATVSLANANNDPLEADPSPVQSHVSSTATLKIIKDSLGRPVRVDHPAKGALSIGYDDIGRVSSLQSLNSRRRVSFGYYDESAHRPSTVTVFQAAQDANERESTKTFLLSESSTDVGTVVLGASFALHGIIHENHLPSQRKYQLIRQDQDDDWDPYQYDWDNDLGFDPFRWMMDEDWSKPPPLPREQCIVDCTESCVQNYEMAQVAICPFYAPMVMMMFAAPTGIGAAFAGAAAIAACGGALQYGKNGCRARCEARCR